MAWLASGASSAAPAAGLRPRMPIVPLSICSTIGHCRQALAMAAAASAPPAKPCPPALTVACSLLPAPPSSSAARSSLGAVAALRTNAMLPPLPALLPQELPCRPCTPMVCKRVAPSAPPLASPSRRSATDPTHFHPAAALPSSDCSRLSAQQPGPVWLSSYSSRSAPLHFAGSSPDTTLSEWTLWQLDGYCSGKQDLHAKPEECIRGGCGPAAVHSRLRGSVPALRRRPAATLGWQVPRL